MVASQMLTLILATQGYNQYLNTTLICVFLQGHSGAPHFSSKAK